MEGYYVHKEPILSTNGRTYGYELFFRRESDLGQNGRWPTVRVDEDAVCSLTSAGIERLTGSKRAFFNVHADAIRFDTLCSLPKTCVFQVSERDGLDKEILLKSAVLKKQGYQFAAEESVQGRGVQPFYRVADFVRVEADGGLVSKVALLDGLPGRRIATRVRDGITFRECRDRGFDLFQGAFFMDPSAKPKEPLADSQIVLMKLSKNLKCDKDIGVIEEPFKNSPKLTYGLLQMINSAFFGVSVKVVSIKQAITLLGYESLRKWVTLLLFNADQAGSQSNPLIEKAILRGRIMEYLAKTLGKTVQADTAFITGMLSLFAVLFDVNLTALATEMSLDREIQEALLAREGFLGILLRLAERAESQEYEGMEADLATTGLTLADVLCAETDAIIDCQSCLFG